MDNQGDVLNMGKVRRRGTFVNSVTVEIAADASIFLVVGTALLLSAVSRGPAETFAGACVGAIFFGVLSWMQWLPIFKRSMSDSRPAPSRMAIETSGRTVLRAFAKGGIPTIAIAVALVLLWGPGLASYIEGFAGGLWIAMSLVFVGGLIRVRREEVRIGSRFVRAATFRPWGDWQEKRSERTWRFFTMPRTGKVDELLSHGGNSRSG